MAILKQNKTGRELRLEPETTIGRSASCTLTLADSFVSGLHASIRWTGEGWYASDLGSRNGTWVGAQRLSQGKRQRLQRDAEISFGQQEESWNLADDSPPEILLVPREGGESLTLSDGLVALPDPNRPVATVFLDVNGFLVLETSDSRRVLKEGEDVEVADERYRIVVPQVLSPTTNVQSLYFAIADVELELTVSQHEEHVGVRVSIGGRQHGLRDRLHNYLLLLLARQRLADRDAGIPAPDEGWLSLDDIYEKLRIEPSRLSLDVYRIRRQFGALGIPDAPNIIERRFDSKEMRIGTAHVRVLEAAP